MGILNSVLRPLSLPQLLLIIIALLLLLMHIIIKYLTYIYYISYKSLLEECDTEENVSVIGAATNSYPKRKLYNILPSVTYLYQ